MITKLKKKIFYILISFIASIGLFILLSNIYSTYKALEDNCYYNIKNAMFLSFEDPEFNQELVIVTKRFDSYQLVYNSSSLTNKKIESYLQQIDSPRESIGHINSIYYLNIDNKIFLIDYSKLYKNYYISIISMITLYITSILCFSYFSKKMANWIVYPVEDAFNKQKQFISDVSHELKTPLAIIQTNTELLQMNEDNQQLDYISYETKRMNQLVTKLLQLSRVESKAHKHIRNNLVTTIQKASMPFEALFFEKGLELEYHLINEAYMFYDEALLEQLVTILLDNALKYTTKKRVSIGVQKDNNYIYFYVGSEGEEIVNKDKIFERFYREDKARKDDAHYGLGLAIAKSIIEEHQASIEIQYKNNMNYFICKFKGVSK